MLHELIVKNRSYRRFDQSFEIARNTLVELVELARLSPCGANLQPFKYLLSCEANKNALIFSTLAWAGYLKDWPGPVEGERPSAYIIILGDTAISSSFVTDQGIALQSILLGAVEKGLGACTIANIQKKKLKETLQIAEHLEILLVVALGKPVEQVQIEEIQNNDVRYWRDPAGVHHVPKRPLAELILPD